MWAIKNIKTNEWVYGTDYRYSPHRQRTSKEKALLYSDKKYADTDFKGRRCGKDYRIVEVELIEKEEPNNEPK